MRTKRYPALAWIRKEYEMTPVLTSVVVVLVIMIVVIMIAGYSAPSPWRDYIGVASYPQDQGLPENRPVTLFMWLSVLIVPFMVGVIGVYFAYKQQKSALEIQTEQAKSALEVQREQAEDDALQAYLDDMSDILVKQNLASQSPDVFSSASTQAQARTVALMEMVGPQHKRVALGFLYQSNLITRRDSFVKKETTMRKVALEQVDLKQADLQNLYLANASLPSVYLQEAQLDGADLQGSDLSQSYLANADLSEADLSTLTMRSGDVARSNLQDANFKCAKLVGTNLQGADLRGAHHLTLGQIKQAEVDDSTMLPRKKNLSTTKSCSE